MDLSMLAYWTIRARLLGVPGVANVAIWGEQLKMLQVQVDPERLAAANVTLDEVMETASDALDVGLLRYSTRRAHRHRRLHRDAQSALARPLRRRPASRRETLAQVPVDHTRRRAARCWAMWPTSSGARRA